MHLPQTRLYLDYNASAPLLNQVKETMVNSLDKVGNASSVHENGRVLRKEIEKARYVILDKLRAPGHALYFTSGATEANALVMHTMGSHHIEQMVSAIEHDSVLGNASQATLLAVNNQGIVDLKALEAFLKEHPPASVCVSVMAANNETGVVQPLLQISSLCVRYGALLHVDAAQAWGRIPIDLMEIAVDYLTLSAHKIGGPVGIGSLVVRRGAPLTPLYKGGGQEEGYRSGTLNWIGILGFAKAVEEVMALSWTDTENLRNYLEDQLQIIAQDAIIAGKEVCRLPNTTCVAMPHVSSETQVIALDLAGIAISAGSACTSGKVKTSHVLRAMGFDKDLASTFIRVSLPPHTQRRDIETFIKAWKEIYVRCTKERPQ